MASSNSLIDRIDAEFSAADQRVKQLQSQKVEEFQGRKQRLENFGQILEGLREVWLPRLKALAQKFGERVDVHPHVEPGRRSASFAFQSDLARIDLRFAVAPDSDVRNLVFVYDLEIIPILMKFDSHDETEFPLDAVDKTALGKWFDDRIVSFVKTYLSLHDNQYYLKDHMVEDPVAKIQFPKYAAGATLEWKGKTYYFIDDATRDEFQQKQAMHGQEAQT
jgi:YHS domain-containing protein